MRDREGRVRHRDELSFLTTSYHFTIDAITFLYCHSYFPAISHLRFQSLYLSPTLSISKICTHFCPLSLYTFTYPPSFLPFLSSFLTFLLPSFFLRSFFRSFFPCSLPSFLVSFLPSFLLYLLTYLLHPLIYPSLPFLFSTIFSSSYQCMEATPSLACANKCVFRTAIPCLQDSYDVSNRKHICWHKRERVLLPCIDN